MRTTAWCRAAALSLVLAGCASGTDDTPPSNDGGGDSSLDDALVIDSLNGDAGDEDAGEPDIGDTTSDGPTDDDGVASDGRGDDGADSTGGTDGPDADADLPIPDGPPAIPANLAASDGTFHAHVEVTWNRAPGATGYDVYRDGEVIAEGVTGNSYRDEGATSGFVTSNGLSLSASEGEFSEFVRLTWTAPDVADGTGHVYSVIATNDLGSSGASLQDSGFRSGAPITRYDIRVGSGRWRGVGDVLTWDHNGAAAGGLDQVGSADASDGVYPDFVELTIIGLILDGGESHTYLVRGVSADGPGLSSRSATGYAGAPEVEHQWQRSETAAELVYLDIDGADTADYLDFDAPDDGSQRYYRCGIRLPGELTFTYTAGDVGFVLLPD